MNLEDFMKKEGDRATEYVDSVSKEELYRINNCVERSFHQRLSSVIHRVYANIDRAYFFNVVTGTRHDYVTYAFISKDMETLEKGIDSVIQAILGENSPISVRQYPKVVQNEFGHFVFTCRLAVLDPTGTLREDGLLKDTHSF